MKKKGRRLKILKPEMKEEVLVLILWKNKG